MDETPDYTEDSDTNPNTTASSVVGEPTDGRKKRSEATLLRRSVFGKKHDVLGESKVGCWTILQILVQPNQIHRKMIPFDASDIC